MIQIGIVKRTGHRFLFVLDDTRESFVQLLKRLDAFCDDASLDFTRTDRLKVLRAVARVRRKARQETVNSPGGSE